MQVVTKLVKTEFVIDRLYVDDDGRLVMENGDDAKLRVRAYLDPSDVMAAIKNGFRLDVIKFMVKSPFKARRLRRSNQSFN